MSSSCDERRTLKRLAAGVLACAFALTAACYDESDYLVTSSLVSSTFEWVDQETVTDLPADGFSQGLLSVRLKPRETDPDKRTIVFQATAGELIGGAAEGSAMAVVADQYGNAVIALRSERDAAEARVQAAIKGLDGFVIDHVVRFVPVVVDDIVSVGPVANGIPADGLTLTPIVVSVSREIPTSSREIIARTSAGEFVSAQRDSIKVAPDASGRATIVLRSPTVQGDVFLRTEVFGFTLETTLRFGPVVPDSILRFDAAPESAPADGATLLTLATIVSERVPLEDRTIHYTTTLGALIPGGEEADIPAGAARRAVVELMSPTQPGRARVTALVLGVLREHSITFMRAEPEVVLVDAGTFAIKASIVESATVTARLLRSPGVASRGTRVTFAAADSLGNTVGLWRGVTDSNADGNATAQFSVGNTAYRGRITVSASAGVPEIVGQAFVDVIDP